jgi:uncharacterized membrane protein
LIGWHYAEEWKRNFKEIILSVFPVCFVVETLAMAFYSNISCISILYIPCNMFNAIPLSTLHSVVRYAVFNGTDNKLSCSLIANEQSESITF